MTLSRFRHPSNLWLDEGGARDLAGVHILKPNRYWYEMIWGFHMASRVVHLSEAMSLPNLVPGVAWPDWKRTKFKQFELHLLDVASPSIDTVQIDALHTHCIQLYKVHKDPGHPTPRSRLDSASKQFDGWWWSIHKALRPLVVRLWVLGIGANSHVMM